MAARGPILLFIGREPNGDIAWRQVRRLCQPGRSLRVSDVYRGMVLLLKYPRLRAVVVAVDQLADSEMSFFSAARRRRPQLHLLALGKGNELSNPRLAQASWQGAQEVVTAERLPGRLSELIAAEQTYPESSALAQAPDRQVSDTAELSTVESAPPKSTAPGKKTDKGVTNFLEARTVAQSKRKAPAAEPARQEPRPQTQDVVTPEELRVLLGQEGEQPDLPKERKQ